MSTNPPAKPAPELASHGPTHSASAPEGASKSSPVPQVPRSSIWWSLAGWLITAGLAGGAWYSHPAWLPQIKTLLGVNKPAAPKKDRIVPVSTAVVRQRDMPLYLNGLGTVTAFKTVTLRSRVEGELVKVAFTEGQEVSEGDLLAEIDSRPFEVQLSQAEGQLARDQAILKTAKLTLSRYEGLVASKSIAAQQLDDQATLVQQTLAGIQTDEATIANARLQLTYCKIVAPISGRIGLRLVDQGNIVRANDPNGLAVITQLKPIALVFTIPQDDIGRVQRRISDGEPLKVDAFDRDFKQKLATGTLLAIDNQVDATTGTVRLKAEFKNEDGMLFPNQFVNARLLVDTRRGAIVVPSAAVQRGPTSMFVYVVKADETVELRNVVPGPAEGGETSIESGVSPGEIVVTDGLDKLQPDAKVAPKLKDADAKGGKGSSESKAKSTDSDKKPTESTSEGKSKSVTPDESGEGPKSRPGSSEETKSPATAAHDKEKSSSAPSATGPEGKPRVSTSCGDSETTDESSSPRDQP